MTDINTEGELDIPERDIQRSKYLLNAAIPESLRGCHPADIDAVKALVFEILDSSDPVYTAIKPALMEGNLFDAAQFLEYEARRYPDITGRLSRQAAILFAPIMTVKAVDAFEQAEAAGENLDRHRAMSVRLYEKMGDVKRLKEQKKLLARFKAENPDDNLDHRDDVKSNADEADSGSGKIAYFPFGT